MPARRTKSKGKRWDWQPYTKAVIHHYVVGPGFDGTITEHGGWPLENWVWPDWYDDLIVKAGFDPKDPGLWIGKRGEKLWIGGWRKIGHPFVVVEFA